MAVSNLLVSLLVFAIALKFWMQWPTAAGAVALCLVTARPNLWRLTLGLELGIDL